MDHIEPEASAHPTAPNCTGGARWSLFGVFSPMPMLWRPAASKPVGAAAPAPGPATSYAAQVQDTNRKVQKTSSGAQMKIAARTRRRSVAHSANAIHSGNSTRVKSEAASATAQRSRGPRPPATGPTRRNRVRQGEPLPGERERERRSSTAARIKAASSTILLVIESAFRCVPTTDAPPGMTEITALIPSQMPAAPRRVAQSSDASDAAG